jgi:2-oxoglutarate/2-oxoacid ferredoxin oxidoreductase subunit alpha
MARIGERAGADVSIRIGGPAGAGIKAAGQTLARAFAREGLWTFDLTEYPSLIRGGHNALNLRVGPEPFHSHAVDVDILVALDQRTIDEDLGLVVEGGAVVFDPATVSAEGWPAQVTRVPVVLDDIADASGGRIMRNTVALGAVLGLLRFPLEPLSGALHSQFDAKSAEIAEGNVRAAQAGYDAVAAAAADFPLRLAPVADAPERIVLDGNEAVGLGALAAGIGLYAAYPMTPASSLLHFMAAHSDKSTGLVTKHTEDEIAAVNMVIGAAFAGARAMCATSGGGFSLMVEGLGLAGVSESAVVVGVFSRPGPATGMPTWTEQGDLRFVIHAAQGEFPRVVLAPGDREDAFNLTWQAFNLADRLQTPVLLLGDMYVCESRQSVLPFDADLVQIDRGKLITQGEVTDYLRYRLTPDGVSERALPGVTGAEQLVNSYEHDEYGWGQEGERADVRVAQEDKRSRKLDLARALVPPPVRFGPDDADVSIVAFGSTKGPIRDAVAACEAEGLRVAFLQVVTCWPFPTEEVAAFLGESNRSLVVENNHDGQLESLIRQECLLAPDDRLRRYDGRMFGWSEIAAKVRETAARPAREPEVRA